jgi:hypothetical protein
VHIILESHLKRVISFFHYISLSCVLITVCLCYMLDIWLLVRLMFNCNAGKKLKFMDVYGIYVDLHSPFRGCICYTGILPQLGVPMNLHAHNGFNLLWYLGWLWPLGSQLFVSIDFAIFLGYRISV